MEIFHLGIFMIISFAHCAPDEYPTEMPEGDPICDDFAFYQSGYLCFENKTGFYSCNYANQLYDTTSCPSNQRCNCGDDNICYDDDGSPHSDKIKSGWWEETCAYIPPPKRPLPDPALFTYRKEHESEWEDYSGPDYTIKTKSIGEQRQDIKNGKYMHINYENSNFDLVVGQNVYSGNLKQETCDVSKRTKKRLPYWKVEQFLRGFDYAGDSTVNGTTTQTWEDRGMSEYEADGYFYVTVENGYTLLGKYSKREGRDWEDEGMMISSRDYHTYNTTYGVDSTHWFDVPRFC